MKFVYSDGGRNQYFIGKDKGCCVCRAICNATGKDFKEIYNLINKTSKREKTGCRKMGVSNARTGVYKYTEKEIIENVLGWKWHATMTIGSGCKVHLNDELLELCSKPMIVRVSKHLTCVKDGAIYDTYDCSRNGSRCVYGYWSQD